MFYIKTIKLKDTDEFANKIFHTLSYVVASLDEDSVAVVGKYDVIEKLIKSIVKQRDIRLESIEIEQGYIDGYDGEYLLTLTADNELWCEKLRYSKGGYFDVCDAVTYVNSECSSACLKNIKSNIVIEVDLES